MSEVDTGGDTPAPRRVRETSEQRRARRARRKRRRLLLTAGGVMTVLVVALAAMLLQLRSVRANLTAAQSEVSTLQDAIQDGDRAGAKASLESIQGRAGSATSALGQPQWSLAARLPFVGDDITAVRTVTRAIDDIGDDVLPTLVDVSDRVNTRTLAPTDGVFDVSGVREVASSVEAAAGRFDSAAAPVAEIEADSLVGPLRGPVRDAQRKLASAASTLSSTATVAGLLPDMVEGDHDYLVVFQNNAELRTQGGLPGAWAQLRIRDGRISIGAQGAGSKTLSAEPVEELSLSELKAFGPEFTQDFRDTNLTPDVPTSARLQSALVEDVFGVRTDGVISLDPVTLSYVLKAVGPVDVTSSVTLTPDNAVDFLLNTIYLRQPDPDKQDSFFAEATRQIFSRVASGSFDATQLAKGLSRAVREHRVSIWSKDASVQERLALTTVGGVLPTDQKDPALGVYLFDATKAKMSYYLDFSSRAKAVACTADGVQTYRVNAIALSKAPEDAATLPSYVVGGGKPPGSMNLYVVVLGLAGGTRPVVSVNGTEQESVALTIEGRPASRIGLLLGPGDVAALSVTMTSPAGQFGPTQFAQTPTITSGVIPATIASACL